MQNDDLMKTYYLATLGCSKNEVDSEAIEADLLSAGLMPAAEIANADVVLVNSCGFIKDAIVESIDTILSLHGERKKDSVLVLCGCLPARYNLVRSLNEVDLFLPWDKHHEIIPRLKETGRLKGNRDVSIRRIKPVAGYGYLKISEGCNNRCAYCSIPDIKGPFVSRPAEELIDEARFLCANGARELVLIGQDTTLYGQNGSPDIPLPLLLEDLAEIKKCEWIRIMYAHPAHLNDELITAIAGNSKVVKYIDLPLQHINDRVLSLMRRRVGRKEIELVIEKLRSRIPGLVLRTTFIVGFPGETDQEFCELLDYCEDAKFDNVGIFKYSPEEGTPAYNLPGRIDDEMIEERYLTILDSQNIISQDKQKARLNKKERVLIDRVEPDGVGYARGWFQAPEVDGSVVVDNCHGGPGQFIDVIIERADAYDLYAKQL